MYIKSSLLAGKWPLFIILFYQFCVNLIKASIQQLNCANAFFLLRAHENLLSQLLFFVDIPAALFHFHSLFPLGCDQQSSINRPLPGTHTVVSIDSLFQPAYGDVTMGRNREAAGEHHNTGARRARGKGEGDI